MTLRTLKNRIAALAASTDHAARLPGVVGAGLWPADDAMERARRALGSEVQS